MGRAEPDALVFQELVEAADADPNVLLRSIAEGGLLTN
jgi:hypothetical protein